MNELIKCKASSAWNEWMNELNVFAWSVQEKRMNKCNNIRYLRWMNELNAIASSIVDEWMKQMQ